MVYINTEHGNDGEQCGFHKMSARAIENVLGKKGGERYWVQERDTRPIRWVGALRVPRRGAPCTKNMERS